jgi:hypothetical protein
MDERAQNMTRMFAIIAVITVSVFVLGCPRAEVTSKQEFTTSDYADSVEKIVLSSALSDSGEPINPVKTFTPDTPEIFCSFWLLEDLCCQSVRLKWQYPDGMVIWEDKDGDNLSNPDHVSLIKPENGFPEGEYIVSIYLGILEIISVTFTVE